MKKDCYVITRSTHGNAYPIMVFLNKDKAREYKQAQERAEGKSFYIDRVTLDTEE